VKKNRAKQELKYVKYTSRFMWPTHICKHFMVPANGGQFRPCLECYIAH